MSLYNTNRRVCKLKPTRCGDAHLVVPELKEAEVRVAQVSGQPGLHDMSLSQNRKTTQNIK